MGDILLLCSYFMSKKESLEKDPSNKEILEAIQLFSTRVDEKFAKVDERFVQIDQRFEKLEGRVGNLEGRVDHIGSSMVTKEYLDEKMSDLRGDLVVLVRKEDKKVNLLVDILHKRHVLKDYDVATLAATEPFAR